MYCIHIVVDVLAFRIKTVYTSSIGSEVNTPPKNGAPIRPIRGQYLGHVNNIQPIRGRHSGHVVITILYIYITCMIQTPGTL